LALTSLLALACGPLNGASHSVDPGPPTPIVDRVDEQEILTPVPVRLRLPGWIGAERVFVHYRSFGSQQWSALELSRLGQTWAGQVPCLEVSTITGDLQYYLSAYDEEDRMVVSTGSRSVPHVVSVRYRLEGGPRGLTGDRRPMRCPDPADCPPDFPGCPATLLARAPCDHDEDCPDDEACAWDGYCDRPSAR
jgi:hypothetical protein